MIGLSGSEMLFWGGIVIMGLSVTGALTGALIFTWTGQKIRHQMEEEYGKPRR